MAGSGAAGTNDRRERWELVCSEAALQGLLDGCGYWSRKVEADWDASGGLERNAIWRKS